MYISNLIKKTLLIALVTLSSTACASHRAVASKVDKLRVRTFTSNLAGFAVNSHLIMGEKDAILVDTQFTRSQAKKVVSMVESSGRRLVKVYITHGHPDHYLGLEQVLKRFPKVEVIARAEVIKTIKETAQGKIDYWKPMYKDDLADKFFLPKAIAGNEILLEGKEIQILDFGAGESEYDTGLYIPSTKALLTGDMTYGRVHFWLAEGRPEKVLENLKALMKLNVKRVYAGHGVSGSKRVLINNIKYVKNFIRIANSSETVEQAKEKMLKLYSSYKLPIILDLSLKAYMKK